MMHDIKCVIVGEWGGGKTSLVMTYQTKQFPSKEDIPWGKRADTESVFVMVDDKPVNLSLWDAGNGTRDDYARLMPLYYPETDIFLVVIAIDNPSQLERVVTKWAPELQYHWPAGLIYVVGCKSDLREDPETIERLKQRKLAPVSRQQGEELAKQIGAIGYLECSSKTQEGLNELFDTSVRTALKFPRAGNLPNKELHSKASKRKTPGRCTTM